MAHIQSFFDSPVTSSIRNDLHTGRYRMIILATITITQTNSRRSASLKTKDEMTGLLMNTSSASEPIWTVITRYLDIFFAFIPLLCAPCTTKAVKPIPTTPITPKWTIKQHVINRITLISPVCHEIRNGFRTKFSKFRISIRKIRFRESRYKAML